MKIKTISITNELNKIVHRRTLIVGDATEVLTSSKCWSATIFLGLRGLGLSKAYFETAEGVHFAF